MSPYKYTHIWLWVSVLYRLPTNVVTTEPSTLAGHIGSITSCNLGKNTWKAKHHSKQRTNHRTNLIFIDTEKRWKNHSRNEHSFVILMHYKTYPQQLTQRPTKTSIRTSQALTKPSAHITPAWGFPSEVCTHFAVLCHCVYATGPTFQARNLTSTLRCLGHLKTPLQFVFPFNIWYLTGGPPSVGCPRPLIQYISSWPSYLVTVSQIIK